MSQIWKRNQIPDSNNVSHSNQCRKLPRRLQPLPLFLLLLLMSVFLVILPDSSLLTKKRVVLRASVGMVSLCLSRAFSDSLPHSLFPCLRAPSSSALLIVTSVSVPMSPGRLIATGSVDGATKLIDVLKIKQQLEVRGSRRRRNI